MRPLGWLGIVRLGLVQMALGAVVVLCTSTLNRIMVIELALPAIVPGALVALHYGVQVLRPLLGFGSDMGGGRTRWILGGVATMALSSVVAAASCALLPSHPLLAGTVLVLAYAALGAGVGAAGTSLLALAAHRVEAKRRAAAATIMWLMMIAGIAVTAGVASHLLDPYSPSRLLWLTACLAGIVATLSAIAVWGAEGAPSPAPHAGVRPSFLRAIGEIWAERQSRQFALFVFVSMLAYSAQELLLEPFAGSVFAMTPGETTGLTGLQHAGVLAGMALVAVVTASTRGYDRRAARHWTTGGCLASALAALALAMIGAAGNPAPLHPAVFLLGVANGAFAVSAIGAMMGLASDGRASRDGTRIGLWGAAQAIAFGAGGLLGTGASDAARLLLGTPQIAYAAVFTAEAGAFLLAARLAAGLFGAARMRSASAMISVGAQR